MAISRRTSCSHHGSHQPPAEIRLAQPVAARTMQQNYTAIENHLPARIWTGPKDRFTAEMCEFVCVDLGLHNASETTVQKLVALVILVTHGRIGATTSSWQHKRSLIDVVKRYLKQHRYQRPVVWIAVLPDDQVTFRAQYPTQWNRSNARGDNQVVPRPHY